MVDTVTREVGVAAAAGPAAGGLARALGSLARALGFVSAVGVVLLLVATTADVLLRVVRGEGLLGVIEWSEMLLPIVAFTAVAYTQQRGGHVASSVLTDRMPERAALAVRAVATVVGAVIIAWILYETTMAAVVSARLGEASFGLTRVPRWPAKIAIALGFAALLLEMLLDLYRLRRRLRAPAGTEEGPR